MTYFKHPFTSKQHVFKVGLCQNVCCFNVNISQFNSRSYFYLYRRNNTGNLQCPQHPDALLVEDYRAGDMVCPECGLVVGDR
jgi:hypothetical protein